MNRERSGQVVECLTGDRGDAGSSLTGVTEFVSLSKNINPSLVLAQPRKTRPFKTERLLMGRKESYQTKQNLVRIFEIVWLGVVIELISSNWKVVATCADSYITDIFFSCRCVVNELTHTRHYCQSSCTHQYTG